MKVKYDLVLDFARPSKTNTIIISEDDTNSRLLHFTLLNDKHPMSMTDITSATIRGLKTDGSVIFGDATILVDDDGNRLNEVEYVIPAAMSDTAGNITITLTLNSMSNEQLTSFEFYIQVRNALYNEDDLVSESDLKGFRDLLNRALAAVKTVEDLSKNETLPNPYPLKIDLEGTEYTYTGRDTVEVYMTDMAYIAEDPVIEVDELDRTSIHVAAQSAAEAKEYADQAKGSEDVVTAYAEEVRETKTILEQSIGLVESYANLSVESGLVSEGYAKGTQNGNPVSEDSPYYNNNAEYFASKVSIEDRLDSASKDKSLSANQGRVLNDSISGLDTRVTYLEEHGGGGGGGTTNYNLLTNKPQINGVTLSGDKSASDLGLDAVATTDSKGLVKPDGSTITIDSDGTIHAIGGGGEGGTTDYNALSNKPQINGVALSGNKSLNDIGVPTSLSQLTEDANHRTTSDAEKSIWNSKSEFSGAYDDLTGKPTIPSALSQLSGDTTHRTVTDAEKSAWNSKSTFSGSYNDLTNKPSIPSALSQLTDDIYHQTVTEAERTKLSGIQENATATEINQKTVTLSASGWTNKHQVITDEDVTSNAMVFVDYGGISGITCQQANGSLTFTASEVPSSDVSLKIGILKGNGTASDNLIKTKIINLGTISGWSSNYKEFGYSTYGIDTSKEEVLSVGIINYTGNCVLTTLIGGSSFYVITTTTSISPTNVQLLVTYRDK